MILHKFKNQADLDRAAADLFISVVRAKPNAVLGMATGGTPVGLYKEIVKTYQQGLVSFKEVTTFNLDEYVGLPVSHPESYRSFMQTNLFDHIDILAENTHVPNGNATDIDAEGRRYDEAIYQQGSVDMQLLGIGGNGHIGFNEPDDELSRFTHKVTLKESTREANKRFFNSIDEVPTHAITMGMGSILHAKAILLVVKGQEKAEILDRTLNGPITTQVPASLLQTHPRVIVMTDCDVTYKVSHS
ncbi:glucosamine-6-phosphate deaminase [Jeongeupia chitinilytica]|uniref:Glucosamine-6-phosphate deaminase n=1 Tax=Jeongeupia chitinilytica TaxID=1041641 RepID=A0ABQ3GWV0_9NEIS|nr:glucosamine-6-phosphate deaminase [Jeongeupia chitinilytica]GHD59063.1 glucosamine-6-phosphate deaminase [Jeongeupia chitinilytica]